MKTILFQGDSVTDADRIYDQDWLGGMGYARLVSAKLGYDRPGEYNFLNRGKNGNRVIDLIARVKCDIINLRPDYMSVLIGVNDVWHEYQDHNGICAERYEILYNMLLEQVKEALPDIKLLVLEPFVLKESATANNYDEFRRDVENRAEISKRVAERNKAVFVPLQAKFDEAATKAPVSFWTPDGVHPTAAGHELIARAWLDAFNSL